MIKTNKRIVPPNLATLLAYTELKVRAALNCVMLGTVRTFYPADQTADVALNYKIWVGENKTPKEYPLLVKCPVVVLSGGTASLRLPITTGDQAIVLFCDREIDTWFENGGTNPPQDARVHDLADGIALVGLRNKNTALASFLTDISSLMDLHGERLAQAGDMKTSLRTADHSGWILMKGDTIGKAAGTYQGEMYRELFDIVKHAAPNAGTESFDGGGTVTIPDMRGRSAVGADNMGGTAAGVLTAAFTANRNVLGGLIGEEGHQLTIPEMPIHHHPFSAWGPTGSSGPISLNDRCPWTAYNTGDTGGDQKHNNVQPGAIFYWFIKI